MMSTVAPMMMGLSPRGRGNPGNQAGVVLGFRSIPAWAGEPSPGWPGTSPSRVYPRVGGGTQFDKYLYSSRTGLSPRGRGNPSYWDISPSWSGSIPAWAGEPSFGKSVRYCLSVYPRVGGGTLFGNGGVQELAGLSPRGRGNQARVIRKKPMVRSIPAWAGEPLKQVVVQLTVRVYPRVGGGTHSQPANELPLRGLSPRGRGNPSAPAFPPCAPRSIPAWAGEPRSVPLLRGPAKVYPRVGGGTAGPGDVVERPRGLSPRGRGNPARPPGRWRRLGSIPAWAGEPPRRGYDAAQGQVYPRVGGGTLVANVRPINRQGLSPRGRGNLCASLEWAHRRRSIPAWAGEPTRIQP